MPATAGEHSAPPSFGEALRRERELRRIALRDVSEATKINIRYLEALERNEFTYLPAGAFTRGFIRSYARFIGTDESEMINAYLYELTQQEKQKKGPKDGQHSSLLHLRSQVGGRTPKHRLRALVVAGLALLLALAIALPLYLHHRSAGRGASPAVTAPHS
jgi:cytoskeletal protein RodZ